MIHSLHAYNTSDLRIHLLPRSLACNREYLFHHARMRAYLLKASQLQLAIYYLVEVNCEKQVYIFSLGRGKGRHGSGSVS